MDEAARLISDRRRYHAHAWCFLLGIVGLVAGLGLSNAMAPWAARSILVASSLALTVSGVLAVSVRRTLFSNTATGEVFGIDPYESPGDAMSTPGIWSGDLAPGYAKMGAPYAMLVTGIVFLAASCWWLFAAL